MLEDEPSDAERDLFEATVKFEHASLRPLYLLNGGAAVAVLAFSGGAPQFAAIMVTPIKFWVIGLVFAAFATFAGYFSQLKFYKRLGRRRVGKEDEAIQFGKDGANIRRFAYFFGIVSLLLFCIGAWTAANSLMDVKIPQTISTKQTLQNQK